MTGSQSWLIKKPSRVVDNGRWLMVMMAETKDVNTVPEAVLVWPPVRYISDTGQYRCTVLGLPLFFIFINIYIYVCVCVL